MNRTLLLATSLLIASCAQEDAPQGAGPVAETDAIEVTLQSRFVEELPTYESVPLPEGLEVVLEPGHLWPLPVVGLVHHDSLVLSAS